MSRARILRPRPISPPSLGESSRVAGRGGVARLALAGLVLVAAAPSPPNPAIVERAAARPPNVLVITTDDQAPGMMGWEGNAAARTPNLDRLADEGAAFTRAYVPNPLCAPSRAAFLTGLLPYQNGVMFNFDARLRDGQITIAEWLVSRGYFAGLVGKWHLGDDAVAQAGFDAAWVTFDRGTTYRDPVLFRGGEAIRTTGILTDVLTDEAIGFVQHHSESGETRPWFLWLAYRAPHFAYDHLGPTKAVAMEPLPASADDDLSGKPAGQRTSNAHMKFRRIGPEGVADRRQQHLEVVAEVDRNVGRLLAALAEVDLERDTLIVFFSDNGYLLGEHQMFGKLGPLVYEEIVRIPLVLRYPGVVPAGARIDLPVSTVDLFPTIAAYVGGDAPAGLAGRSLRPVLDSGERGRGDLLERDALLLQSTYRDADQRAQVVALVTSRFKYADHFGRGEELYDLVTDPHEERNLAGNPEYRDELARFRARLHELWTEAGGADWPPNG